MKPARDTFDKAARSETPESEENWVYNEPGRYHRSYEALSDALLAIFEKIYLPQEIMGRDPRTGTLNYTEAGMTRYSELENRFMIAMQDDEVKGQLEIEICPASYKGLISTGLSDSYIDGPDEIRQAIIAFFSELNEITAGIDGVRVSPQHQSVAVAGPKPFLDMIVAICNAKGIATAESSHENYAARGRTEEEEGPSKPGHYAKPFLDILKMPRGSKKNDPDLLTGTRFRQLVGNKNMTAEIPEPVFRAMGAQCYGLREIGNLINKFNSEGVLALFSVNELKAIVDQDLEGAIVNTRSPAYNIH